MGKLTPVHDSALPLFAGASEAASNDAGAPGGRDFLIVEADGGSRGNPGHAGYGALVRDPKSGAILVEKAGYVGIASNNVAEYSGLIAGLQLAHEIDPGCRILVRMDSKLVVEQMSGRWKIKHADMQKLAGEARRMVDPRRVRYEWIPRERNKDADRLSNEAMDAGMAGTQWSPRAAQPAEEPPVADAPRKPTGTVHHVEIRVADLEAATRSVGWLFERLGFVPGRKWNDGGTWVGSGTHLVLHADRDVASGRNEYRLPGVHRLAFNAGTRAEVDLLARRAQSHGWSMLSRGEDSGAGGAEHYAVHLETAEGFAVELIAEPAD